LHAGEPELLRDWPKEVEREERRQRNIAMLNRMTATADRERHAAMGFWRYWWDRFSPWARACRRREIARASGSRRDEPGSAKFRDDPDERLD